jgi:hypothetical protein
LKLYKQAATEMVNCLNAGPTLGVFKARFALSFRSRRDSLEIGLHQSGLTASPSPQSHCQEM